MFDQHQLLPTPRKKKEKKNPVDVQGFIYLGYPLIFFKEQIRMGMDMICTSSKVGHSHSALSPDISKGEERRH